MVNFLQSLTRTHLREGGNSRLDQKMISEKKKKNMAETIQKDKWKESKVTFYFRKHDGIPYIVYRHECDRCEKSQNGRQSMR